MGRKAYNSKQMFELEGEAKAGEERGPTHQTAPLDNSRYNEYYVGVKPGGGP
jgi:hypothetical protein